MHDGGGTGGFQLAGGGESPTDPDPRKAQMARGSHVVEPVADHDRRPELVRGRQRRLQDRHLAQLRIVRRWIIALGSVDAPEEGVQALETE